MRLRSEGLVVASALLVLVVHVAEMVRLVAVVAVGDDRVFDALALKVIFLVEALQLAHQLLNEVLWSEPSRTERGRDRARLEGDLHSQHVASSDLF